MPKKVLKKVNISLLIAGIGLVGLTGCSTIGKGVDSVGAGVIAIGEGFEKMATDVTVEKVESDQYALAQTFHEPVASLDSWAMRIEAREVCPEGYIYLNRSARKSGGFELSDADCAAGAACSFKLEWQIKCQEVPDEPFSLFGKT